MAPGKRGTIKNFGGALHELHAFFHNGYKCCIQGMQVHVLYAVSILTERKI
jgi:hypothetical protein